MKTIFVGRQAIYDREQAIFAYELLFRANSRDARSGLHNSGDGELATSQVIINTFTEIGLDNIVGTAYAFINLTKDYLLHHDFTILPPERVVLELLEHVIVDKEVIERSKELSQNGYTLALDDFVYSEAWEPLIEHVSIIKIDVMNFSDAEITRHLEILKPYKVKLLAEKVETHDEYHKLREMGFDYFQGYFLSKPNIVKGQALSANRFSILQLLGQLNDPKARTDDMEKTISRDVTLSYKLLRYLNSSWFALSREIDSIRSAIIYLGLSNIQSWATMVAISAISDKPHELTISSLVRGRMCELLAEHVGRHDAKIFFTVGFFSYLDALMDQPMDFLLKEIPLSQEIKAALLHHEGEKGQFLSCVRAYEEADWDHVDLPGIEPDVITDAYLNAIAWAREAGRQLQ